ncbi:SphA family protein [Marinomonas polaris]|uniref:SphA family protein n=1 Tax=Marinomonas polaris TaxID=293552 RepID=UPI003F9A981A
MREYKSNFIKADALFSKTLLSLAVVYSANTLAANPSVSLPKGTSLGSTSFFDGFSGDSSGLTYLLYIQRENGTSLKNNKGKNAAPFDSPNLDVTVEINQFDYKFEPTKSGDIYGISAFLPIVSLDSSFGDKGPQLKDNGTGLGDLTLGGYIQFLPTIKDGHPVFSHRLAVDFILPTGEYDVTKDFNQSNNYLTVIPNWSFTILPAPRVEVSGRINYLYNFENSEPAGSSPMDWNGGTVNDTQAGQAFYMNFATSYEIYPGFRAGINGYYLKQLTDDKVNGDTLADSKEEVLGLGPGVFWSSKDQSTNVWVNTYSESMVENRFRNELKLQFRIAHKF